MEPIEHVAVRLPLWRSCLETMLEQGVTYGATYSAEFFEQELKTTRDTMQFGLGVSEIRRELEQRGFYLSGRGGKSVQWVVLPPNANCDVAVHYNRMAVDSLRRGLILLSTTPLQLLNTDERKKHEAQTERTAMRVALLSRSRSIHTFVKKEQPKLLES